MGKVNTAQLTRKDVYVGIKNHMSISDFCKTYSIEEDQFKETVKQIFRDQSDKILRQIAAGSKKAKVANRRKQPISAPPPSDFSAPTGGAPSPDQAANSDLTANHHDTLASLTAEVHNELEIINQLTSSNADLTDQYEHNLTHIDTIRQELEKIQNELAEKNQKLEQLLSANDQIQKTFTENAAKRSEHAASMRKIMEKIKELKTIEVFVYRDGNIEVANSEEDVELDDSGHEDLYDQLIDNPEYDDLTVRDIRTLSRTVCIVQNLKDAPVEVAFEVSGLEPFFMGLVPSVV